MDQPLDPAILLWFHSIPLQPFYSGFLSDLVGKESACKVGDLGLILVLGRSPGGGHGNPLPGEAPWTEEPDGLQSMGSQSQT